MRLGKRMLAALLLSLVAITSFGCSKPAQSKPKTTIRLAGFEQDPLMKVLIEAYQSKHPDVGFEHVSLGAGGWADLQKVIKEDKVDLLPGYAAFNLAGAGLLEPFDAFVQKDGFDTAPLGRLADLQANGRLYDLPYQLSPFVLMYNQDLIKQAGITVPAKPMTWDEFRDLARRLTSGEGNDRVWGFHSTVLAYPLEVFIRTNTLRADWWNDTETVGKGYQFFSEMIFQDRSTPQAPDIDEYGRPKTSPDEGFGAGKAALTISTLNSLGVLKMDQLHVGATFLPAPAGREPVGLARPLTISMSATAENMDAAWSFVHFLTGPDAAVIIAQHGVLPAYRKPEIADQWLQSMPGTPAELKTLATMELKLVRDSDPSVPNRANEQIRIYGVDAFMGKHSWQEAFEMYKNHTPLSRN